VQYRPQKHHHEGLLVGLIKPILCKIFKRFYYAKWKKKEKDKGEKYPYIYFYNESQSLGLRVRVF